MKSPHLLMLYATSVLSIASLPTYACTDFKLTAKDGTILITRSMEFGEDVQSSLNSSIRGRAFSSTTPGSKPGLAWKAKYGYVYLNGFGMDVALDGMNEQGLTFEYLYLPSETSYQDIPNGKEGQTVPYTMFGDWVLSNYKTVDEVKKALNDIYVVNQKIPQLGDAILPAHASIYDASGKGIVVEFYNNKINVSDSIGVMTNSPKYDWQVTNLRNFINLTAENPKPVTSGNMIFNMTGQGSGAVGLPGDASPPSRFVKTSFMVNNSFPVSNTSELVNLAEHIINNVDLPAGYVRATMNGKTSTDTTQWVVFKDITHKKIYYRTYNDMTLRSISFDKLDFSDNAPRLKMPLANTPVIQDKTQDFLKSNKK